MDKNNLLFPGLYECYKNGDHVTLNLLCLRGLRNFLWHFKVWRNIRWFSFFMGILSDTFRDYR